MKQSDFLTTLGLLETPYTNRRIEIKNGLVEVSDLDGNYIHSGTPKEVERFLVSEHPTFTRAGSGAVASVYNPADTFTYNYGMSGYSPVATTTPPNGDQYNVIESAAGISANSDGTHYGMAMHWGVTPGKKTITGFRLASGFLQSTHIYSWAIDVWRSDTSVMTLVATSGLIAADAGSAGSMLLEKTLATPLEVTLVAGQKYYIGFRAKRKNSVSTTPYLSRSGDESIVQDSFCFISTEAGLANNTLAKAKVAGVSILSTTYSTKIPRMCVIYNSGNYIEQEITASLGRSVLPGKTFLLATAIDAPYVIRFNGLAVGDTKSLTCKFKDLLNNGTGEQVFDSFELDCGNSTPSQNDLIFNAKTANLLAIGGQSQAADPFDLFFVLRHVSAASKTYDLLYQNRYQDDGFHSHGALLEGARGSRYAATMGVGAGYLLQAIEFSGTFDSLGAIQVGVRPLVMIGESQTISGSGSNTLRALNTSRLGSLPTQLSKPRIPILLGQAGKSLTGATGLEATLFRSSSAGVGDACELLGLGCEWMFAGIGINDISSACANDNDAREIVAKLTSALATFSAYILDAGEKIYLAGLPPYSSDANADQYEGEAARWFNRALVGLALAWRVPYYNPWPDMVQPGTEDDTLPEFLAAHTSDAGTHYSATGGAIVVANIKAAIENGTIDLRDLFN